MSVDTLTAPDLERLLDGDDERTCELWTRALPLALFPLEPCCRPAAWVLHIRCGHGPGTCPTTLLVCAACKFRIDCGQRFTCRDDCPEPVRIVWTEPLR